MLPKLRTWNIVATQSIFEFREPLITVLRLVLLFAEKAPSGVLRILNRYM